MGLTGLRGKAREEGKCNPRSFTMTTSTNSRGRSGYALQQDYLRDNGIKAGAGQVIPQSLSAKLLPVRPVGWDSPGIAEVNLILMADSRLCTWEWKSKSLRRWRHYQENIPTARRHTPAHPFSKSGIGIHTKGAQSSPKVTQNTRDPFDGK